MFFTKIKDATPFTVLRIILEVGVFEGFLRALTGTGIWGNAVALGTKAGEKISDKVSDLAGVVSGFRNLMK